MSLSESGRRENSRIAFIRAVEAKRIAPDGRQFMLWPAYELPNPFGAQDHYTIEQLWDETERLRVQSHHVGHPAGVVGY